MVNLIVKFAFWSIGAAIMHTYFVYPVLLYVASLCLKHEVDNTIEIHPSVTLVIAAYNEEGVISEKIENSLELNYPSEKIEIVVFSDASSDRTDELVKSYASEGVRLKRIEGRVGKTECQNRVVDEVNTDIIVFSDSNSMYESDSILKIIEGFESGVGCVVGELRYKNQEGIDGESVYWKYERLIKKFETRIGSLVGGNGAIYAVKTEDYVPLSAETISDFAEPLAIIQRGKKVQYASNAIAWETTSGSSFSEKSRRVRIVTRCWYTVMKYRSLLNPVQYPIFSFKLISHKILRWLSPLLLVLFAVLTCILSVISPSPVYDAALAFQGTFYLLATFGSILDITDAPNPFITYIPYYFVLSNYGMAVGLWNFVFGSNIVTWDTLDRT